MKTRYFLRAGETLAQMGDGQSSFTCLLIRDEAHRDGRRDPYSCDEVRFHEQVHDVEFRTISGKLDPDGMRYRLARCMSPRAERQSLRLSRRIREVRLMALALSYTLAVEHNAGRFRL